MHIAFFAMPSPGHVYPTLGIVAELTRRGHRVSYSITERLQEAVVEAGAHPVLRELGLKPGATTISRNLTGSDFVGFMSGQLDQLEAIYPVLSEAFAGDEPDLVVCEGSTLSWEGPLLADRWGVPVVHTFPTFASNEHWSLGNYMPRMSLVNRLRSLAFVVRLMKLLKSIDARLKADDLLNGTHPPQARLAYFPRAFQFAGETFDESYNFVGPCFNERAFQGSLEQSADPDRRLVVVTIGSGQWDWPEFFPACVAAFADLPWRFVIAVGGRNGPSRLDLGPVPENIEFHQWIPLQSLLPHADLHICSAGMGSAMESLYHGVPVLAIPHVADQFGVADRIVELGLGRKLDADEIDARSLREAVVGILGDEQARGNVREMQSLVRDAGGPAAAADIIEQVKKQNL
jgi:MGT family glycosyltransferase